MDLLNAFTVSFFGHRDFNEYLKLEPYFENLLKDIISSHEYVDFLVGRNGEFDQFVSSTIRRLKRDYCSSNNSLICVLTHKTREYRNDPEALFNYYDELQIHPIVPGIHHKALINDRNENMIIRSHLVICYVKKTSGGAYTAMCLAKKHGCPVINLADYE